MFFQTIGAAITVSGAQAAFINVLLNKAQTSAPGISPKQIIATGATSLRQVFHGTQLVGIIKAYMSGLQVTFIIVLSAVLLAFLMSTYIPWTKKLGEDAPKPEAPAATGPENV